MNVKKIVALVVSFVIIFSVFSFDVSAQTAEDELRYGTGEVQRFSSTGAISASDLAAYSAADGVNYQAMFPLFVDCVCNFKDSIDVKNYGVTLDNLLTVVGRLYDMLWTSNPEVFYLSSAFGYDHYSSGRVANLYFEYECTKSQAAVMSARMQAVADEMVKDLKKAKLTDVQKALVLHDRLAVMCEYDESVYSGTETYKVYTAYGALVEGLAVCDGYTKAYTLLLRKLGIESKRCTSTTLNHAWNIVYIDGKAYHVDVTWDDPLFANPSSKPEGFVRHTNFMISTYTLKNNYDEYGNNAGSHTATDFETEPQDTTYDSYFWRSCTHETILIGNGLYHLNDSEQLCNYDSKTSLARAGVADMDGNYKINSTDVIYFRKFVTGKLKATQKQITAGDFDGDGKIGVTDLVRLKKILLYI